MEDINFLYEKTKQSLIFIDKNNPNKGIQILQQVKNQLRGLTTSYPQLSQQINNLQIVTLNNLACAFNKKGKYKASLFNLQTVNSMESNKLLKYQKEKQILDNNFIHQIATTHSNLCAVYSKMGQHKKALQQIKKSIQILENNQQTKQSQSLIVFYYNCAIQYQYINCLNQAYRISKKGFSISANDQQMLKMYQQCLKRIEEKMKRRQKRIGQNMIKQSKSKQKYRTIKKPDLKLGLSLHYLSEKYANRGTSQEHSRESLSRLSKNSMRISEYSKKVVRSINNDERPFILIDSKKKKSSLYQSNNKMVTKKKLIFL